MPSCDNTAISEQLKGAVKNALHEERLQLAVDMCFREGYFVTHFPYENNRPFFHLDGICDAARLLTLEVIANDLKDREVAGNVAEVGVAQGDFAQYIHEAFLERKLYLFDTFSGFDSDEFQADVQEFNVPENRKNVYNNCSAESVLKRMKKPENCIVRQGLFPATVEGIDDTFAFVSLDCDLYKPLMAGLHYFYDRMVSGGIIFVHDYGFSVYGGSKKAVRDFCRSRNISFSLLPDRAVTAVITKC